VCCQACRLEHKVRLSDWSMHCCVPWPRAQAERMRSSRAPRQPANKHRQLRQMDGASQQPLFCLRVLCSSHCTM
jgi:hypothetical protein